MARLTIDKYDIKIWNKELNENSKDNYYISGNSKFIKNFFR